MSFTRILHILHTNDIHSRFEQMPHIATCLKVQRSLWEKEGEHVLTLDIGDHVDRSSIKTESSWGRVNVEILNRSGYQYVTIGNNEGITLPKDQLNTLYNNASFSVIVGNILDSSTDRIPTWAIPYAIHEWEGFRVALLGVTVAFHQFYNMLGWTVQEPLTVLAEQVKSLRDQVDAIIVMSHLGYSVDKKMAQEIEGIDVILGGHTHHLLERGERIGATLVAQAGKLGEYVGHIRLIFQKGTKEIVDSKAEVYLAESYGADLHLQTYINQEQETADRLMSQPIATLSRDLTIKWETETPFGAFLAASIRKMTGSDIGLANGGLLLTSLRNGDISRKDLLECAPHPIKLCAITLTGKQIRSILHRALQPEMIVKEVKGFGFRGKILGWMGLDGITVQYEGQSSSVESLEVDVAGQPLDLEKEYRVGTIDMFLLNRLFPEFQGGKDVQFFLPEVLRELLAHTISDDALVQESFSPRWKKK